MKLRWYVERSVAGIADRIYLIDDRAQRRASAIKVEGGLIRFAEMENEAVASDKKKIVKLKNLYENRTF